MYALDAAGPTLVCAQPAITRPECDQPDAAAFTPDRQQHEIIDSARKRAGFARERTETAITELLGELRGSGTR